MTRRSDAPMLTAGSAGVLRSPTRHASRLRSGQFCNTIRWQTWKDGAVYQARFGTHSKRIYDTLVWSCHSTQLPLAITPQCSEYSNDLHSTWLTGSKHRMMLKKEWPTFEEVLSFWIRRGELYRRNNWGRGWTHLIIHEKFKRITIHFASLYPLVRKLVWARAQHRR